MEQEKTKCAVCGKELKPAPARFDGEATFVGYLPHACTLPNPSSAEQMPEEILRAIYDKKFPLNPKDYFLCTTLNQDYKEIVHDAMEQYASLKCAEKDKLIKTLDKIITSQWEFIEDVKKGQQGELKAAFIHRITKRANELIIDKLKK